MTKRNFIIITGQEGVGKSTIIRSLVRKTNSSAQIDGEDLGQVNPMVYEETLKLIWKNLVGVTQNFWDAGFSNVIAGSFLDGYHQYREFRQNLPDNIDIFIIQLCAHKSTRDIRRMSRPKRYNKEESDWVDTHYPEDEMFSMAKGDFYFLKIQNDKQSVEQTVSVILDFLAKHIRTI